MIGTLYGGNNADATGNVLNVKANATVKGVKNFEKIHFEINDFVKKADPLLKVTDIATDIQSLEKISINEFAGKLTLIENNHGINIQDGVNRRGLTKEKTEQIIEKASLSGTHRLQATGYQFKDADVTISSNTTGGAYGGQSVLGNATVNNKLTVTDGIHDDLYGGHTDGSADSGGNTVTITGGEVRDIYGGYSTGGGATQNNIVNLGNGEHALKEGTTIGTIYGGNHADATRNVLNVKANATAANIENFEKVKFYLNSGGVAASETTALLKLTHVDATKVNWDKIDVVGYVKGQRLLLDHTAGDQLDFEGADTGDRHENLSGDREVWMGVEWAMDTHGDRKPARIKYEGMQYRGDTVVVSTDGTEIYGGHSRWGNSTVGNTLIIEGGSYGNYGSAYGGKTEGSGTDLADRNTSRDNKVFLNENVSTTQVGFVRGDYTNIKSAAHIAQVTGNRVTVEKGTVTQEISGGYIHADTDQHESFGDVKDNHVTIKDGTFSNTSISGGATMGDGNVEANTVTITGGTFGNAIRGGYSLGDGIVTGNSVAITGGTLTGDIYGGHAHYGTGSANGNTVTITGTDDNVDVTAATILGGESQEKDASDNTVDVGALTVSRIYGGSAQHSGKANGNTIHLRGTKVLGSAFSPGDVYGGSVTNAGGTAKDNMIHLYGATVSGTVYGGRVNGGSAADATGNTLVIHSHTGGSTIGDFQAIQNLHFLIDNDADHAVTPMLKLSGVTAKDISGLNIGVGVSGAAKVMKVGETIRLLQTQSGAGLTTDAEIQNQITGEHGVSVRYKFDIKKSEDDPTALIATVTSNGMMGQTKSFVETRAGLTDLVNLGGDALAGESLASAQQAAASARSSGSSESYAVWAGMGSNSMRVESGSHVDTKAWSINVGWARQDAAKDGQLLFTPFVEYGRGTYDSYVEDETTTVHGNGKISYFGVGVLARMDTQQGLWYEGSLRGGRATSDYKSNVGGTDVSYDGSNTYYAAHLGIGKDIRVRDKATVTPYLRYFYSHQNGMTTTFSSGDVYNFGSVNSHRLRLGLKYTCAASEGNELYAGLAWEYEMNGEATATYQGDSAPSPSLKGSSGMLELGYRFTPAGQPLTYDLHLTGWQGKRRGVTVGAHVSWAF